MSAPRFGSGCTSCVAVASRTLRTPATSPTPNRRLMVCPVSHFVCLPFCLPICASNCLPRVSPFAHSSTSPPVCSSVLVLWLSVLLLILLSALLTVCLCVCLSVCLSCLSISQFFCPSVCLFVTPCGFGSIKTAKDRAKTKGREREQDQEEEAQRGRAKLSDTCRALCVSLSITLFVSFLLFNSFSL